MHIIALDNPVVPLRPGDGRAEPDLLVGWLFIEYVGADCRNGYVQNTGLGKKS